MRPWYPGATCFVPNYQRSMALRYARSQQPREWCPSVCGPSDTVESVFDLYGGQHEIIVAIPSDMPTATRQLVAAMAREQPEHMTLVMLAVKYHEEKPHMAGVIRALLAGGSDVNRGDPLQLALAQGNYGVVIVLLDHSPVLRQNTLHQVASSWMEPHEKLQIAQRLIRLQPRLATQMDDNGRHPIHTFCRRPLGEASCQLRLLELLYSKGGGRGIIHTHDASQSYPLHHAAAASPGSSRTINATIDWLLERGAAEDINDSNLDGNTPLALVAANDYLGHQKLMKLIKLGAVPPLLTVPAMALPPAQGARAMWMSNAYLQYLSADVQQLITEAIDSALRPAWSATRVLETLPSPRLAHPNTPPPPFPINDPIYSWRIASFLADTHPIEKYFGNGRGAGPLGRRSHTILSNFVSLAASLDVTADEGRVEQLAEGCFVVGGVGCRRVGLHEVVRQAIREEAARHGMPAMYGGGVDVVWGQLGVVNRCGARWERQRFVVLGLL
ncbi:unnamed protein product [Vitrella brassicaformis CCMP3155]|uniref:Uncharacterized protein n=1 Tax=Vitrella brassicaformis (strain CCMP3155) TaxID=1169540 RepID=A0A0G4FSK3_VITBC|nr:unnamed protein product [Vitrella brassicaformis CCMP3155]|eukprot:CEM17686.1 unnamed protein product [Vitrella brassicaformis CCMP3155]